MAKSTAAVLKRAIRSVETRLEQSTLTDRELLRRFAQENDQPAFATLVRRYTGMVLGVCRRELPNVQDAEDACQATFLVLARKATAGEWRHSVANWLYTTARKIAANTRRAAQRRARREGKAAVPEVVRPVEQITGRELLAALAEELDKLPPRYREPLILCYLEGLTRDEVATRLGVPVGTVKIQLERGRKKLGDALTRRDCGLGAGLLALAVTSPAGAVPPRLIEAVLATALGSPPAAVAALAKGVTMNALLFKQNLVFVAAAVALLGIGLAGLSLPAASQQTEKAPTSRTAKAAQTPASEKAKTKEATSEKAEVTFAGRVLDPDGKPVAGARVYRTRPADQAKGTPKPRAVTGKDGTFRFRGPPPDQDDRRATTVYATAAGFGLAWVRRPNKIDDLTLRLAKDDVPVTGRVLNLEGKPVAGVSLKVTALKVPPGGSLTPWLEAVKTRSTADGITLDYQHLPMFAAELNSLFPTITTGTDGRFSLRGVGRERAVALLVEGPTIETREINVLTRSGVPTITVPWYRNAVELGDLTYYAAGFDHAAAPCRPVSGVVRDKATGKSVVGATVRAERGVGNPFQQIQTTTDRAGRYRLTGLPGGQARRGLDTLVVLPPDGQAYLSARKPIDSKAGIEPAVLDFEVVRGVWIEGRVTDKDTGKGVEAGLGYYVFWSDNPGIDLRGLHLSRFLQTDRQGRFRFIGVPGRALLGARARGPKAEHYRIGVGADKIEGKETTIAGVKGVRGMMFRTLPHYATAWDQDVLAEVKPPKGADKMTCNLVLDPGLTQTVRILGPDGKPLEGVRVAGQFPREFFNQPLKGAECTIYGLSAGEQRALVFQHEGKKLSGLLGLKVAGRAPVEVKLQASAAVSGRLVDTQGKPLRHADITVYYERDGDKNVLYNHSPARLVTDAEGRFRTGGMVPGIRYLAHVRLKGKMYPGVAFDLTLKAGESRDLGDVKTKSMDE